MPPTRNTYAFPAMLSPDPVKRWVKCTLGRMVLLARPGLGRRLRDGVQPAGPWQRCALQYMLRRMERRNDQEGIARVQRQHWASAEVVAHHESAEDRFDTMFMHSHRPIVGQLLQTAREAGCRTLCEIGCGTGRILAHFATQAGDIDRFIGIDLSPRQTEINRAKHRGSPIEFVAGDAVDWIGEQGGEGWAFLCYGGVLEYFLRNRLDAFLGMLAQRPPVVFGLVEPLDPAFDPGTEVASKPFGLERSLSHPYPRLFQDAGFQVCWQQETNVQGIRFLMMVARASRKPQE